MIRRPRGSSIGVRAVTPLIAATAAEAEAQRRPLDHVIEALKATGVFRSFVPARYGGYEIDMSTFVDISLAVSRADPSMGWITTFYMEHNWLLTMFADELRDEVFGSQPYVLAPGSVNPTGRATPLPGGGCSLTGHWQFGTGICHADWVLLSGRLLAADGSDPADGDGARPPMPRYFLVPVDAVEVQLRAIADRIDAHARGTVDIDLAGQQQMRLALAHVVRRSRDVVREILASSGASVHYLDNELQRIHRDVHMIAAHTAFDVDLVAEGVGRELVRRLAELQGGEP